MSLYYFTISAKNDCHVRSMDVKDRIKNNWLSEYSIALPERLIYKEDFDGQKELYNLEKSMLDLSSDYISDDYFGSFWTRQLALMVLNINRMEGTLSAPSRVDSVMMKSILNFIIPTDDTIIPCVKEWNSEGGRNSNDINCAIRQLYQCSQAAIVLLKNNLNSTLSISLILQIYKLMMENSYVISQSAYDNKEEKEMLSMEFRTTEVSAGYHQFLPSTAVMNAMRELCVDYNAATNMHPVELATSLFQQMISIHPFRNGNGRLCRLFMCWSLMKSGFPFPFCLSTGHKKARRHYLHAIQAGRKDDGNLGELNAIAVLSMKRVINNFTYNLKLIVRHKEGKLFKGKKRKANTPLYEEDEKV